MRRVVVQKFGGTSVKSPARIKKVARRVISAYEEGFSVVVVASAMGDTTDRLIDLADEINPRLPDREYDMLVSTGEQVSISLLVMALKAEGYSAVALTGSQAGIITDSLHARANIEEINTNRINKELEEGKIVAVAGFQGMTRDFEITTLGRGGSDATAVALAAALNAIYCEIYTDVDGVYTADPDIVQDAVKLKSISYEEMLEMAALGAEVLQPRSVEYAHAKQVNLYVRSSLNYNQGTMIKEVDELNRTQPVTGVACDTDQVKISMCNVPDRPGIASRIFSSLAESNINVDMIIQNVKRDDFNDISFTIDKDQLPKVKEIINELIIDMQDSTVEFDSGIAKVSIVGAGMISNPGIAAKMFTALGNQDINIEMISTSEIKISCLIDLQDAEKAVKAIHCEFELDKKELKDCSQSV